MDFIDGFALHDDDKEGEECQQKWWKKADGASSDNKGVKSLKFVMKDKAVQFSNLVVKEIFGFQGDRDVGQQSLLLILIVQKNILIMNWGRI
jgi:hypothetical protein